MMESAEPTVFVQKSTGGQRWKRWLVPTTILLMAAGILILITE